MNLDQIQNDIKNCTKCDLYKYLGHDNPVPGEGNQSDLMFLGEAPGSDEATLGRPFVGLCGQLLDRMLLAADIKRENCYICNTVNCRPTVNNKGKKNRPPTESEIQACKGWLWLQIQAVNPKIIVTLGKIPTYTLLNKQINKSFTMKDIIGNEFNVEYHGAKIVPSYHPSYLLQHGKQHIESTIELFKKIKSMLPDNYFKNWANEYPRESTYKSIKEAKKRNKKKDEL